MLVLSQVCAIYIFMSVWQKSNNRSKLFILSKTASTGVLRHKPLRTPLTPSLLHGYCVSPAMSLTVWTFDLFLMHRNPNILWTAGRLHQSQRCSSAATLLIGHISTLRRSNFNPAVLFLSQVNAQSHYPLHAIDDLHWNAPQTENKSNA